jgi:polyferredoxin
VRSTVELTVLRDRSPLFVTLADGGIRNGYSVKVLNKSREPEFYVLTLDGLPGARLAVVGDGEVREDGTAAVLDVKADSVGTFRVTVRAEPPSLGSESTPVRFRLDGTAGRASQASVFLGPKP